jgi:cyclohexa-1,5-dienecarbonyl-CoA hydratase
VYSSPLHFTALKIKTRPRELLITVIILAAAKTFGFVNEVFDDRMTLSAGVDHFIKYYILPKSASSLRYAVKASRKVFNKAIVSELKNLENMYLDEMMETEDSNEGIISFLEKRNPIWKNK